MNNSISSGAAARNSGRMASGGTQWASARPGTNKAAATLAVAVAATSVPLVFDRTQPSIVSEAPGSEAPAAHALGEAGAAAGNGLPLTAAPEIARGSAPEPGARAPEPPAAALPGADTTARSLARDAAPAAAHPARVERRRSAKSAAKHGEMASVRASSTAHAESSGTAAERGRTEPARASTLSEEARLISEAMLALGAGDAVQARRCLEDHARRFPGGLLERERERALERLAQAAHAP